jgi:octaprenyl-diphosphate synthase
VTTSDLTDAANTNPNRSWNQIVEHVNPFLQAVTQRLIQQANDFDPKIVPYAQSALNGSGKHLRPTLVALAGSAIGKTGEAHVAAAVIIEMVHLATLVHGADPARPAHHCGQLGQ